MTDDPDAAAEAELNVATDIVSDYKTHRFLDLGRPLLLQVWFGGFSKEFYLEQVHKPRHYKGGESAPLFGNFLEPLSKTPWWVVPTIWLPCVAYGLVQAQQGLSVVSTGLFFGLGLCIWTFIEYGLHRCLFHLDE
jgi:4-hydroxysphinganine ceramide fatty acyl 2-hydroxylase